MKKEEFSDISSLLDEAESLKDDKKNNKHGIYGREVDDYVLHYDIGVDDELVKSMKILINNSNIKKSELYRVVGRQDGYNLHYSLKKGVISWKRVETWCNVLGVQPVITFKKSLDKAESPKDDKKNKKHGIYGREVDDYVLHYDVEANDDELVKSMKILINNSNIKKSELYNTVGRQDGYNLHYSLKKGVISWKRVEIWCNVLGVQPVITFKKSNN